MAEPAQKRIVSIWSQKKDAELRQKLRGIHADDIEVAETALTDAEAALAAGDKSLKGQGIYIGQYSLKDGRGNGLGKTFNVFAAPQDLTDESGNKVMLTYEDTVKRVSKLKNWNGFDGNGYADDTEIYKALKDGSYNGGWIIPTRELLYGVDADGYRTQPDNLYAYKDKGFLAGTFCTAAAGNSGYFDWYWSSTEFSSTPFYVWYARLSDGNEGWFRNDHDLFSCRPVRLVEVPGL